jgi:hypothetical protein
VLEGETMHGYTLKLESFDAFALFAIGNDFAKMASLDQFTDQGGAENLESANGGPKRVGPKKDPHAGEGTNFPG